MTLAQLPVSVEETERDTLTPKAPSKSNERENKAFPDLLTPQQVNEITGIPVSTLAFWRFEGSHLRFVKLGRLIRYRRQDVLDFINENVYDSTAEAKAA